MIAFVTNDEECRSIQLLRYFDEENVKPCGHCDVCLKKNRMKPVEYQTMEDRILGIVGENGISVGALINQCADLDTNRLMDAVRFLIDNGALFLEPGGFLSKGNKKSRHF